MSNNEHDNDEPTVEYSESPVCYDISNNSERPKHNNWVIPAGTTMLVDYDHVVKRRIADHLHQQEIDFRERFGLSVRGEG